MFSNCNKLTYIKLDKFDTSKAVILQNFFSGCESLSSIILSKICENMINLDLNSFYTKNIVEMEEFFLAK